MAVAHHESWDDRESTEFWHRHWPLAVLIAVEVVIVAGLYVYHVVWSRVQRRRAKRSTVQSLCEAFSLDLLRQFCPTARVEKYRFRGLQQKAVPMTISFEDLGFELKDGTRILEGVTGDFPAGRVCAIMGPSGAGKTTFMNVLCGKATYGRMTGKVFINGRESTMKEHRSVVGFVPQEDVVHERLTVGEQIRFAAELRNSPQVPHARRQMIAEDVLNVMQIGHISNSVVGGMDQRGVSGGQRKRVSIGLEIAADPSICFLDEPTSGLDASSSFAVIHSLRKMTQLGMTCAMVVHQPRYALFQMFDDVLLLGTGGRTVYQGPALAARPYFERLGFRMPEGENPADWLMDVIVGDSPNTATPEVRPEMLPDLWQLRFERQYSTSEIEEAARSGLDEDGLRSAVEKEWERISSPAGGDGSGGERVLRERDLVRLLKSPDAERADFGEEELEAARELLRRITGARDVEATKQDVLEFLGGLSSVVAQDKAHQEDCRLKRSVSSLDSAVSTAVSSVIRQCTLVGDPCAKPPANPQDLEAATAVASSFVPSRRCLAKCLVLPAALSSSKPDEHGAESEGKKRLPGPGRQLCILLTRCSVQWWRGNLHRSVFLGVLATAAVLMACMDSFIEKSEEWQVAPILNLQTCLALLTAIFCLGTFGTEKHIFYRESASGLNTLAFFYSKTLVNLIDLLLQCFLYTSLYYVVRQPLHPFGLFIQPYLAISWAASGIGYFISAVLQPRHGPFVAALVVFVSCGLLGHPLRVQAMEDGGFLEACCSLFSITRWSVGWSFLDYYRVTYDADKLDGLDRATVEATRAIFTSRAATPGEILGVRSELVFLVAMGLVWRAGALAGLRLVGRGKRV